MEVVAEELRDAVLPLAALVELDAGARPGGRLLASAYVVAGPPGARRFGCHWPSIATSHSLGPSRYGVSTRRTLTSVPSKLAMIREPGQPKTGPPGVRSSVRPMKRIAGGPGSSAGSLGVLGVLDGVLGDDGSLPGDEPDGAPGSSTRCELDGSPLVEAQATTLVAIMIGSASESMGRLG